MLLLTFPKIGLLAIFLGSCTANLVWPFPTSATEGALKFQPVLDFDKDACYQTSAIGIDGSLNQGLEPFTGECRDRPRLTFSQTYVRQRCNHGWCAYLYGYYFEKDDGFLGGSHKNDWEHIIVWTLNDKVFFVSWSAHGNYTTEYHTAVRFQDNHPKLVYHRGLTTHSFRKATAKDDAIENITGEWFKAPLVSLERMACDIKRKLLNNDWGHAHPDLSAGRFATALNNSMPQDARNNEHFNPWN
ncbi:necrosis inducing protein [Xylariaceae sp. FL1651]|nr:necrosis inducing protein [Xylariaceae sp. FL1651]